MDATLLASAPSLDELSKSITKFYCGEPKVLISSDDGNSWKVARPSDSKECFGVRVVRKGKRFRFEMV